MYKEDIQGSQAYAKCLNNIDLLTDDETKTICTGLDLVLKEWDSGIFQIKSTDEDIHTANERRLQELIGEPATKLHVGRSRNDQVATDLKLWLKSAINVMQGALKSLVESITIRAQDEIDVLMPGYTHLQRAQPVRWSHWLLCHGWSFRNDSDKLQNLFDNINVMPLGSGAIAGNPFNINRQELAKDLGFKAITANSMQAVGDRDFIADFLYWASLTGIHLTRLAEDLILYSSKEFNFVQISDAFSTGSSLMPQKRNPDSLELVRGIGAGLFGLNCSFMMTLKGTPTTYNKDLQSDKELLFGAFDKLILILKVCKGTLETLKVNKTNCEAALSLEMLATDVAYYLVRKNVPFRRAHHLAGQVVALAEDRKCNLNEIDLPTLQNISNVFDANISSVWNYENSVEQYKVPGGTAKSAVEEQIINLKK